jgi:hypothetical protein
VQHERIGIAAELGDDETLPIAIGAALVIVLVALAVYRF